MSESDHHRCLVRALAYEIADGAVWGRTPMIYCDLFDTIEGTCLPPLINGSRPDVFARDLGASLSIIGEAKTANDIDNPHTCEQLISFFDYLGHLPSAELWMGVPWLCAGTAMRICTHARARSSAPNVVIRVVAFMMGRTTFKRVWRG